jgi:hypothetical protein
MLASDDVVTLEWKDPLGLCGCSIFKIVDEVIVHKRIFFDELSFLRAYKLLLTKI